MAGDCGSCTACCRVFAIPALAKRAGDWCQHCNIGVGCTTYQARPVTCVEFSCLWLQSRQQEDVRAHLPDELRPDRCKVVFGMSTDPAIVTGTTMPGAPLAWQQSKVRALIDKLIRGGLRVVIGAPRSLEKTMIDRFGQHPVQMTEPDENGLQWNVTPDRGPP